LRRPVKIWSVIIFLVGASVAPRRVTARG